MNCSDELRQVCGMMIDCALRLLYLIFIRLCGWMILR